METELLKVEDLRTYFHLERGVLRAVDGISLSLSECDTLGIVGESGSGKSVTALSIMRLIDAPPAEITSGRILFEGEDLVRVSKGRMRSIRGSKIAMIFQEPMTSLNPVFRVGSQISEAVRLHGKLSRRESLNKAIEMLELVGIPAPTKRVYDYPHQLSGGMLQRVMIAMAICCRPKLLLADEPTTALDVTIQAQILDVMERIRNETGTSLILITHNMGVIAEAVQKVIVMYAGKVMEYARTPEILETPCHPYTINLLKSMPRYDHFQEKTRLYVIPGIVPDLLNVPRGCIFSPRCDVALPKCAEEEPPLFELSGKRTCRCWLHET